MDEEFGFEDVLDSESMPQISITVSLFFLTFDSFFAVPDLREAQPMQVHEAMEMKLKM